MSRKGRQGRMSECSGPAVSGPVILEEPEGSGGAGPRGEGQARDQGPLRCAVWPRQQTWLCVVPLLIGFIGLGLSLMLLKWIVVGTVRDYVPTDLVDANRIGQDPIFLSKPSGIPKSADTSTTTTATAATVTPTMEGGDPAARTVARGRTRTGATSTTANPRGGGSQVTPRNPGHRNGRGPSGFATTTTSAAAPRTKAGWATSSPSPANPTVLHDSTQMWTAEQTSSTTAAATGLVSTTVSPRTHGHRKTPSPTVPPLHSEHFKPCHEKDLAYCLNGGECFVIETLSGPHKHCKCREGYQGIRCDQFLPKTDSILSDPNHLGIEFMESTEVYQRQVLSITSIAMAISLLGALCMALYCRSKRRREKLQAHLKESRSLKNYAANAHNTPADSKTKASNINLQMHEYCKRSSLLHQGGVCEPGLACSGGDSTTPPHITRSNGKHHRSGSLSHLPDQRTRTSHWSAQRRAAPIARGRLNPIGGSKYSGPAYQHLQEVDASEREAERRGFQMREESQDASRHKKQSPSLFSASLWNSLDSATGRNLRRPGRRSCRSPPAPPPPFRSYSIPIIPSVQGHSDGESSCMQTRVAAAGKEEKKRQGHAPFSSSSSSSSSSSCSPAAGRPQDEVALLLEEAQEQLRVLVLAHRKQGEGSTAPPVEARETVCFLNGGGGGLLGCNGPTQTQLLSPGQSHRDLRPSSQ